jgi:DNA-binding response OmpR family regulator
MTLLSDIIAPNAYLTQHQARIAREILDRGEATRSQIMEAVYGDDPDGGPLTAEKCIKVHMVKLRRALAPGLRLHNRYQIGWSIVADRQEVEAA